MMGCPLFSYSGFKSRENLVLRSLHTLVLVSSLSLSLSLDFPVMSFTILYCTLFNVCLLCWTAHSTCVISTYVSLVTLHPGAGIVPGTAADNTQQIFVEGKHI